MKLLLSLFVGLVVSSANAAIEGLTVKQVVEQTGLTEKFIVSETEKSLEAALFYQDDGISCGLEEFVVTGYQSLEKSAGELSRFEVITEADGPVNYCAGSVRQTCYTTWSKKSGSWKAAFTECEEGVLFEE